MRNLVIILAMSLLATSAFAMGDLTGEDAPSINLYEIIAADGTYGSQIDIDDFLGKVVAVNIWRST